MLQSPNRALGRQEDLRRYGSMLHLSEALATFFLKVQRVNILAFACPADSVTLLNSAISTKVATYGM